MDQSEIDEACIELTNLKISLIREKENSEGTKSKEEKPAIFIKTIYENVYNFDEDLYLEIIEKFQNPNIIGELSKNNNPECSNYHKIKIIKMRINEILDKTRKNIKYIEKHGDINVLINYFGEKYQRIKKIIANDNFKIPDNESYDYFSIFKSIEKIAIHQDSLDDLINNNSNNLKDLEFFYKTFYDCPFFYLWYFNETDIDVIYKYIMHFLVSYNLEESFCKIVFLLHNKFKSGKNRENGKRYINLIKFFYYGIFILLLLINFYHGLHNPLSNYDNDMKEELKNSINEYKPPTIINPDIDGIFMHVIDLCTIHLLILSRDMENYDSNYNNPLIKNKEQIDYEIRNFFDIDESKLELVLVSLNIILDHQKFGVNISSDKCIFSIVNLLQRLPFLHEILNHGLNNKLLSGQIKEIVDLDKYISSKKNDIDNLLKKYLEIIYGSISPPPVKKFKEIGDYPDVFYDSRRIISIGNKCVGGKFPQISDFEKFSMGIIDNYYILISKYPKYMITVTEIIFFENEKNYPLDAFYEMSDYLTDKGESPESDNIKKYLKYGEDFLENLDDEEYTNQYQIKSRPIYQSQPIEVVISSDDKQIQNKGVISSNVDQENSGSSLKKIIGYVTVISLLITLFMVISKSSKNDNLDDQSLYGGSDELSVVDKWKKYASGLSKKYFTGELKGSDLLNRIFELFKNLYDLTINSLISLKEFNLVPDLTVAVLGGNSSRRSKIFNDIGKKIQGETISNSFKKLLRNNFTGIMNNFFEKSLEE